MKTLEEKKKELKEFINFNVSGHRIGHGNKSALEKLIAEFGDLSFESGQQSANKAHEQTQNALFNKGFNEGKKEHRHDRQDINYDLLNPDITNDLP